ncbi:MAG: HNH endonuclease [Nocardioides sp.]
MTTTAELRPEAPAGVLVAAKARRRAADAAEADLLQLAVEWAVMHPAESIHAAETHTLRGFGETDLPLAGEGAPSVAEFCVAEFAAVVGLPSGAGKRYVGEALELCYRLPRLWWRVTSGDLPAWKARLVARETIRLTPEAATFVDRHVAPVAHRVRTSQLDRLVAEAIGRFMPDEVERLAAQAAERRHVTVHDQQVSFSGTTYVEAELDLADALDFEAAVAAGAEQRAALGSDEPIDVRRAQAVGDLSRRQLALDLATTTPAAKTRRVVLHVHLSEAALQGADRIGRLEQGCSLVTVDQIRGWCGNPDAQVVVKPVVDLDGCVSVDSYEVPDRVSEEVGLRDATCVFPVVHPSGPALRLRPHRRPPRRRGDLLVQPRRLVSAASSAQDPLALELRRARPRSLPLDQPPRLPVPPRPSRHHRRHVRPATSGALARHLTALLHPGDRRGSVGVLGDVDDRAVRIPHEEPS